MNYDIKITGEDIDNGLIEFDRLNQLTKSTKDIATKTLMFKLTGYSDLKPDKHLQKALYMYLDSIVGNEQDGTTLTIDCINFSDTIKGLQLDLFNPNENILNLTPMALVIESFQKVLEADEQEVDLDKSLLKSLSDFKKNFITDNQVICLSNRGTIAEVKLTKEDFSKIKRIEARIPKPQNVIVSGTLDELKVSKKQLGLKTDDGLVIVNVGDISMSDIYPFIGKGITISGKAYYKSNGQLNYIEISEFWNPAKSDALFSKKPKAMTAKQQLLFNIKQHKKSSSLKALMNLSGLLKDDIDDKQFEEMIKDIRR